MALINEIAINVIPRYSDFVVSFPALTRNGVAVDFNTVGGWRLVIASGMDLTPTVIKMNGSGHVATNAAFTIATGTRTVTVAVSSVELGHRVGTYFVNLYAETSGTRVGINQMYFYIQNQVPPS